jgi:hypothetical protein
MTYLGATQNNRSWADFGTQLWGGNLESCHSSATEEIDLFRSVSLNEVRRDAAESGNCDRDSSTLRTISAKPIVCDSVTLR